MPTSKISPGKSLFNECELNTANCLIQPPFVRVKLHIIHPFIPRLQPLILGQWVCDYLKQTGSTVHMHAGCQCGYML